MVATMKIINELLYFVTESNKIEGIHREPTEAELAASQHFIDLSVVQVADLCAFVSTCAPGATLRTKAGMNVQIGDHLPPPGGPLIKRRLEDLLERANKDEDPYTIHVAYETLHPFLDGNGRSGRILWAWQMLRIGAWPRLKLGFLHAFYYQSLSGSRRP